MRRLIFAAVLAVALIIPATASAIDPPPADSVQVAALASPDAVYTPAVVRDETGAVVGTNACAIEFTPNLARSWWTVYFADPVDLADVRPGLMPGSLVLSAAEYTAAVTLNARGNTLPDAPRDYNPLALATTAGLVGADGVAFCPTDSAAPPVPLGIAVASVAPASKYATAIAKLKVYIARLSLNPVRNAAKLALYRARLADYLSR